MKRLTVRRITGALVLAISLTGTVAVTSAKEGAGSKSNGGESCDAQCYLGCYADDLDLSDAQKAQMQERIDRFRETTAGLRAQLKTLREQSRTAEDSGALNESAVRAAAQTRANLRVELEIAHARLMSELIALLTPEQKAKRAEQQRQREERRRAWRARRMNN